MASQVNRLKAAFWCRMVFKHWGVSSPQELANYKSKSSAFTKKQYPVDHVFALYKGGKNSEVAFNLFYQNNNLTRWRDYFSGKSSPSSDFIVLIDKLVPGSAFFYSDGAKGMFNVMSAETPELAIEIFKDNLLIAAEKSEGEYFYKDKIVDVSLSENKPPCNKYKRIIITDEDIESVKADNWLDEFRVLDSYLPNIDSFYLGFPMSEIDNLYIRIAYEVFRSRFLTDKDRYNNLAKILFAKSQIEALNNFEKNMGIPSNLWLEIPCIKSASEWYSNHIASAAKSYSVL